MIPKQVEKKIHQSLTEIEQDNNIKIFYACESGSRAWGFPSTDSDYDVRFLYIHRPEWYLSIDFDQKKDVIVKPITNELDISGWDVKKVLKHIRKSNPSLLEWLRSPHVYIEKYSITKSLRKLLPNYFSTVASSYHYLHTAQRNVKRYLKGDKVWTKRYFYILRPILACRWLEQCHGPVPVEFDILVEKMIESERLKREIDKLLLQKKRGQELDERPKNEIINKFIKEEMERLESKKIEGEKKRLNNSELNQLFLKALEEVWNDSFFEE